MPMGGDSVVESGMQGAGFPMAPQEMPPSPPKHQPSPLPARPAPLCAAGLPAPGQAVASAPAGAPLQPQLLQQHSAPALVLEASVDEWYSCMITRDANRTFGVTMRQDPHSEVVQVASVEGESARQAGVREGSIVHSIASQELGQGGMNRIKEIIADPAVSSQDSVAFVFRHPAGEAVEAPMSTPLAAVPVPAGAVTASSSELSPKKPKRKQHPSAVTKRYEGKPEAWGAKEIIAFFYTLESHGRNFHKVAEDLTARDIPRNERQARNFYSRLARRCVFFVRVRHPLLRAVLKLVSAQRGAACAIGIRRTAKRQSLSKNP
eukprot:COSAG02_NODE_3623_length_6455_cov_5.274544_5_plen_320_part_00